MGVSVRSFRSTCLAIGPVLALLALLALLAPPAEVRAAGTVFFDATQSIRSVASGTTSETLLTEGYEFTLTRDKLFTGGVGLTNPVGRSLRILWPDGLEAQAVTAGPSPGGARVDVRRPDGLVFSVSSFTARLLANTAGAGAGIEVMPLVGGEDARADPFQYTASGFYGQTFQFQTPELANYEAYKITLYVDFALTGLSVLDATPPRPRLRIIAVGAGAVEVSWPVEAAGYSLESAPLLMTGAWGPATNAVGVRGDQWVVGLEPTMDTRYFRLRN